MTQAKLDQMQRKLERMLIDVNAMYSELQGQNCGFVQNQLYGAGDAIEKACTFLKKTEPTPFIPREREEVLAEAKAFLHEGKKIKGIQVIRKNLGLSLVDSKALIESL